MDALGLREDPRFHSYSSLHQLVDYCKLRLLCDFGGVCLDADSYIVGYLDSAIDFRSDLWYIATLSSKRLTRAWSAGGRYRDVNNAFFAAPRSHPAVARYLAHVARLARPCAPFDHRCVQRTTGPDVLRTFLETEGESLARVQFLASEVAEPCCDGACRITPRTVCVHESHLSWVLPAQRSALRLAAWCSRFWLPLVLCVLLFRGRRTR